MPPSNWPTTASRPAPFYTFYHRQVFPEMMQDGSVVRAPCSARNVVRLRVVYAKRANRTAALRPWSSPVSVDTIVEFPFKNVPIALSSHEFSCYTKTGQHKYDLTRLMTCSGGRSICGHLRKKFYRTIPVKVSTSLSPISFLQAHYRTAS